VIRQNAPSRAAPRFLITVSNATPESVLVRRDGRKSLELLVGSPELFLGALPGAQIDDRRQDAESVVSLDGIQPDLYGNFRSVAAASEEFASGAHRAAPRKRDKRRAVLRMRGAQVLRHEHVYRPPEQVLPRVPEESLDFAIDENDRTVAIDHHHAARRRFECDTKQLLVA
jgi:hypothetical protein